MATQGYNPFALCRKRAPAGTVMGHGASGSGTGPGLAYAALHCFLENRGNQKPTQGSSTTGVGVHYVTVGDATNRRLELYTLGNAGISAGFHASSASLPNGAATSERPDLVEYNGYVFVAGGDAQNQIPGDYVAVSAAIRDAGGASSFTDETSDANTDAVTLAGSDDVTVFATASDAFYIGYSATFGRVRFRAVTTSDTGFPTANVVYEYWTGAAWAALSGVTNRYVNLPSALTYLEFKDADLVFTVPGDWATTTVNSQGPFYYIRVRTTSGAPLVDVDRIWVYVASTRFSSVCYHVGDDTATTAPAIVGWGIDVLADDRLSTVNPVMVIAPAGSSNEQFLEICATFYDSTRKRESTPGPVMRVGASTATDLTFYARTHGNTEVDKVRVYVRSMSSTVAPGGTQAHPGMWYLLGEMAKTTGSLTLGTTAIHSATTFAKLVSKGSSTITTYLWDGLSPFASSYTASTYTFTPGTLDPDLASGPVADPLFRPNAAGTFYSACAHRNRIYCFGSRVKDITNTNERRSLTSRLVWSARFKPHYFPVVNAMDVLPEDGDEAVAVRSFDDKLVLFKQKHIYFLTGEPTVGAAGIQVVPVSTSLGCIARGTIVISGAWCYFLSAQGIMRLNGNGVVEPVPMSAPIRDSMRKVLRDNPNSLGFSCAGLEPTKNILRVAMPGVQETPEGSAGTNATLGDGSAAFNDGLFSCHLDTMQWAITPGVYIGAFCQGLRVNTGTSHIPVLVAGTYDGRLIFFSDQAIDGTTPGSLTITGTATAGTTTTLTDSAATFRASGTDASLVGMAIEITGGTGVGQRRQIADIPSATQLTIDSNWTTTPSTDSTYRIGLISWSATTGDLQLSDPSVWKALTSVRIGATAALTSPNTIDVAVDATDVDETGTGFTWAAGTLGTGVNPSPLFLAMRRGLTQRLRLNGWVANAARTKIRSLVLHLLHLGRAGIV